MATTSDTLFFDVNRKRLMALMLHGLKYGTVTLFVSAAYSGVVLPSGLKLDIEGCVRLDYNLNFHPPIPDLLIDAAGVIATLSFSQVPFETFIPWLAVRNMYWEHELPVLSLPELDAIAAAHIANAPVVADSACAPASPRRLRRITQLDICPETTAQDDDADKTSQEFAAHGLRAV